MKYERTYQDDLNTAVLSEILGVPPAVVEEIDDDEYDDEYDDEDDDEALGF